MVSGGRGFLEVPHQLKTTNMSGMRMWRLRLK